MEVINIKNILEGHSPLKENRIPEPERTRGVGEHDHHPVKRRAATQGDDVS